MGDEPDYEIEDEGQNFRQTEASIKQILLDHLKRCMIAGSDEMKKGGFITKRVNGKTVLLEAPNQREIFINTVTMFEIPLLGFLDNEPDIKTKLQTINNAIESKEKEFKKEYSNCLKQGMSSELIDRIEYRFYLSVMKEYRNKLAVLALLLKKLNYFDEMEAMG